MNITENTLVFKLGADNNFSDLKITTEIKHFIADLIGNRSGANSDFRQKKNGRSSKGGG